MNAQSLMARPVMMPALRQGNALPASIVPPRENGIGITAPSGGARITPMPEAQAISGGDISAAIQNREQNANQMFNQAQAMAPGMWKDMATAAAQREIEGMKGYQQAGQHFLNAQGTNRPNSAPIDSAMRLQADIAQMRGGAAGRMSNL